MQYTSDVKFVVVLDFSESI